MPLAIIWGSADNPTPTSHVQKAVLWLKSVVSPYLRDWLFSFTPHPLPHHNKPSPPVNLLAITIVDSLGQTTIGLINSIELLLIAGHIPAPSTHPDRWRFQGNSEIHIVFTEALTEARIATGMDKPDPNPIAEYQFRSIVLKFNSSRAGLAIFIGLHRLASRRQKHRGHPCNRFIILYD